MEPGVEHGRKPGLGVGSELNRYYALVGCYFFAFGMQFVLFPSLVARGNIIAAQKKGERMERSPE